MWYVIIGTVCLIVGGVLAHLYEASVVAKLKADLDKLRAGL